MTFSTDISLQNLLTFFLFVDLVVMVVVGIYTVKSRHKKGKTEQLLEEIRDVLRQNPNGCAEKLTSKSNSDLTKNVQKALKKAVQIKEEAAEEKPPENKPTKEVTMPIDQKQMSIDRERIYYEIEESTEACNNESSDFNLVKNALKDEPVIKPLLKMPKYIDELVNRSRQSKSPTDQKEVVTSAESTGPPPLPPPPTPTQTTNTKKSDQQGAE